MKKIFALSLLCVLSVAAFAQRPYSTFVSQDISYDDNIYLTKNGKVDSGISVTKLGGKYTSKIPNTGLNLSAMGYGAYNAYTEDNGKNGYWEAGADLELKNEFLRLTENFIYTSDPANSELTDRAERLGNFAELYLQSSNKKTFSGALKIADKYDYYIDSDYEYLTRNRISAGAELHYNLSGKTTVFAEYIYSNTSYKDNDESESQDHTVGIGAKGDLFSKVTGKAGVRYTMRDYDKSIVGADSDEDLFGYYADLKWNINSKTSVGLGGNRAMEETIYGVNRFYISTSINAYVAQKIYDKFTAALTVGYENMDYTYANANGTKRNDDFYKVRPSVDYSFNNWLSAGVWYQYRNRTSNVSNTEYANNKAGAFVKAIF
ncbi:hypothetical protein Dip510_001849 [Elusimicrobium posterum]|uniref:outer membrane beta-barrel protein n=1 Tax=Elusimicrobium posterum TaxID=3116653 RepID=UPI003C723DEA